MERLVEESSYRRLLTCGRDGNASSYLAMWYMYTSTVLTIPLSSSTTRTGWSVAGKLYDFSAWITEYQDGIGIREEVNISQTPRGKS